MERLLLILFTFILLVSCKQEIKTAEAEVYKVRLQKDFQKIDFHSHYKHDPECLETLLEEWNMKTVLVDVAAMDPQRNELGWSTLKTQFEKHPDRYYLCTSFAALDIDSPYFAERTINKLQIDVDEGAVMVKVWKVHGMEIKDADGDFIQIDDPRIQPVWDYLASKRIPVMAHIAEPQQAWRPLQEENPHYNYYKSHPEYHAYRHPEIPSWETIIAARDRWIENNPDLIIVAAHLGSMSHDVDLVATRLDKYPNLYVEPAARFGDLTGQDSKKVREFFIRYQDRILYGTDLGTSPPAEKEETKDCEFLSTILSLHWKYFTEKDSVYFNSPMISFPVKTVGLDLPDSVLRKVYRDNALKILQKE